MGQTLKVGVVGAGVFGGYHASKCAAHPRIDFVGIFDPHTERAQALAGTHGGEGFADYDEMVALCDAVIIASPGQTHTEMAGRALRSGCHVLIEKPMASDLEGTQLILDLAEEHERIVQVDHQERFVIKAIGLDRVPEQPTAIRGHRHAAPSPRGTDVSVTMDLMTHDIDLANMLMGGIPQAVSGHILRGEAGGIDKVDAKLTYAGGIVNLSASRMETASSREMVIRYPSGTVSVDFNAKTLTHDTGFDLNPNFGDDPKAKDSLGASVNAFVEAILDGTSVPVSGVDGQNAVRVALALDGDI